MGEFAQFSSYGITLALFSLGNLKWKEINIMKLSCLIRDCPLENFGLSQDLQHDNTNYQQENHIKSLVTYLAHTKKRNLSSRVQQSLGLKQVIDGYFLTKIIRYPFLSELMMVKFKKTKKNKKKLVINTSAIFVLVNSAKYSAWKIYTLL